MLLPSVGLRFAPLPLTNLACWFSFASPLHPFRSSPPKMASNVSSVYIHVVDDVINKVHDEFINFSVEENVLTELQALWEMKMLQCGAISGTIERPPPAQKHAGPITPVHDLNVPYEGPAEEYETPTAEMLFPPTPLRTPIQTPLPRTDQSMYNIPTAPSDYAPSPTTDIRNGVDLKAGRPSPYMQPPSSWMTQRPWVLMSMWLTWKDVMRWIEELLINP